jgi:predicted hydrocarbon binding protein
MNIMDDLIYSMLSYSKNYQPYVHSWGKRVGKDLVKDKLELEAAMSLKAKNVFEHGLISGALEELSARKMPIPKTRHSLDHYHRLKLKAMREIPNTELLKISYPHLYLSPGSHTLLYWIGKESGLKIGKKHDHKLAGFKKVSKDLKVGNLEFKKNKFTLHDSVFAKNFKENRSACSYFAGFAAGFLSSHDKKINVIETKCVARGHKKCEFKLLS